MRWTTMVVGAGWALYLALLTFVAVSAGRFGPVVAFGGLLGAVNLVLATLLARRVPGNALGPVLAAAGVLSLIAVSGAAPPPLQGDWMLLYVPYAFVLLLVPDGRFGSAARRRIGLGLLVVVSAFNLAIVTTSLAGLNIDSADPSPAESAANAFGTVLLLIFMALLIASAVSVILRYRRANERQRLQLRWIFVAGASVPLTLVLCWVSYFLTDRAGLVVFGLVVMFIVIPAAVTISVVRPTWFDVDRAAVATLTAAVLSGVILIGLALAGAVAGLRVMAWSPEAAIGLTMGLALLMIPLYSVARRLIGRLVYPERERAVSALRRLRARVDAGEAEPEQVEAVLRGALRDEGLTVAYHRVADQRLVGLDGAPPIAGSGDRTAAVRLHGEAIGALIASPGRVKPPARAVAEAAAPILDAVRLRAELTQALAEIGASRERLLLAGYRERRRLERDLHDGAQQRLVALGMRLRVLQRSGASPEVAAAMETAVAELGTAVAELRHVAHGVRPSALDDGLAAALSDLVRLTPDVVDLDVQVGDLPDSVSITAYYLIAEAVANAIKHAGATSIHIVVRRSAGQLQTAVVDDGAGGACVRPGGGLAGLQDRVAAIGGRMEITSQPGTGTRVEALLPCAASGAGPLVPAVAEG